MNLPRIAAHVGTSAGSYGLVLLLASTNAHSAPGELSSRPLFIGSNVPPNIMFLVDDSTSMRNEVITKDLSNSGAFTAWDPRGIDSPFEPIELIEKSLADVIHRPGCPIPPDTTSLADGPLKENLDNTPFLYRRVFEDGTANYCEVAAEEEWRVRTAAFNTLYYNPDLGNPDDDNDQPYPPWGGADINGDPYEDAVITAVRINPYDPSAGTINLLTDAGVFVYETVVIEDESEEEEEEEESSDTGDTVEYIVTESRNYYDSETWETWCTEQDYPLEDCQGWRYYTWEDLNEDGLFDNGEQTVHWVHQLTPDEQTQFANWFQYHRSREFATKAAFSIVIDDLSNGNVRAGLMTLDADSTPVLIDNLNPDNLDQRDDMLTALFIDEPNVSTTPLRERLNVIGEYFTEGGDDAESPILPEDEGGACQNNATILMTDGFYNDNGFEPEPEVAQADNDAGVPYEDNYSGTLADIAMYYYQTDLSPLANLVANEEDPLATHQHMNTYVVAFGLNGSLDPDTTDIYNDAFEWPNPEPNASQLDMPAYFPQRIDDLWHATINGRGMFISADNTAELIEAVAETTNNASGSSGSANSVGLSSFFLTDTTLAFVTTMESIDWSSDLMAFSVDDTGEFTEQQWSAAGRLNLRAPSSRVILTYDPEDDGGIAFDWGSLSDAQKADLNDGDNASVGEARLDYVRGDRTQESSGADPEFRKRSSLIGDIIHSSPIYVGPPALFFPDEGDFGTEGARYSDFWTAQQDRDPTVYIAANDGMLHGFDATTGSEVLAYVPSTVFPKLAELTDPDYTHEFYVDMTPTIADAFFDGAWHTVAVGGLGAGGRGIYALDITDPSSFSEANADATVLWEFNANDDQDLGYTLSRPIVALTNTSDNGGKRWAVIVGNGYNADEDDNTDEANATLFILFLDADLSDGWDEGTDYKKISVPLTNDSPGNPNGLSSPAGADIDRDGLVDRVYAGDVKGNLWAFDISDSDITNWGVAYGDAEDPEPLFTAKNAADEIQPITTKPSLTINSDQPTTSSNQPNVLVLFGTGQYITESDPGNTDTQTFYGIWDAGQGGVQRDDLTVQEITLIEEAETSDADGATFFLPVRAVSDNRVPYEDASAEGNMGWVLDLDSANADTGERVIANPGVSGNVVFFTTFVPGGNTCDQDNQSWFMALDALSGGPPAAPTIDINQNLGVDSYDVVVGLDTNVAGIQVDNTAGAPTLGGNPQSSTGDRVMFSRNLEGGVTRVVVGGDLGSLNKRLSWREPRPE